MSLLVLEREQGGCRGATRRLRGRHFSSGVDAACQDLVGRRRYFKPFTAGPSHIEYSSQISLPTGILLTTHLLRVRRRARRAINFDGLATSRSCQVLPCQQTLQ